MLEVRNLVKEYKKFRAVNGLDLQVRGGEIVGLLGPNGAGKTTSLRCMGGILRPTSGQVLIGGHDIVLDQAAAKAKLAFVPEVPSLYDLLTVEEHIKFVAMCFNKVQIFEEKKEMLMDKFDLLEKRNELVAGLSKGMRQKLSVACALVHEAELFLFDEPLIGIDPAGAHEFKQELVNLKQNGAAVVVSTHLLDTAERLCDRVIIMQRGTKKAEGTLESLQKGLHLEGKSLEEIFLLLTEEEPVTK